MPYLMLACKHSGLQPLGWSALCPPDSTHVTGSLRYLMRVNTRYHNLVHLQFRLLSHFQNEVPSYWVRYNEKYGPLSLSLSLSLSLFFFF